MVSLRTETKLTMKRAPLAAYSIAASRDSPPTLSQYLRGEGSQRPAGVESVGRSDVHVDRTLLLEDFRSLVRLVVERDVDADRLHEFDLIFRARGRDHLETIGLGKLDDGATLGFR